ncbi:helix-turn-helix transcriptional regulator [Xanthobacter variabilis]|uniref:helix-turn-helix transcriptional regulator n=1 Tax=Xanthobacter variabilis TaxID=3119932 RepID=UPI00372ADE1F
MTMPTPERLDDVIYAIYGAALDPELWPQVLSKIGAVVDGEGAIVLFYKENAPSEFIHAPELHAAVRTYLNGEWWTRDLHALRAIEHHLRDGDVMSDFTIATKEEMETHPIYTEFFRSVGFGWLMSAVMLPDFGYLVALSVPRAKDKPPFSQQDMETLRLLGRHVEQALRVSMRIANLDTSQVAMIAALDAVSAGIYALDASGRRVMANKSALAQFASFFCEPAGRMMPRQPAERPRFQAMVKAAMEASASSEPPHACVLSDEDGQRLAAWALPVRAEAQARFGGQDGEARTLIVAVPLEQHQMVAPAVIRDMFGLSLGEARLAALIGSGVALQQAAGQLGITQGTARVVLKRVFSKLGINRQTELVLQLSKLTGW